jgi:HPt (histidine-containing phosphotransfer) domain-containing protein
MRDKLREIITRHCRTLRDQAMEIEACLKPADGEPIGRVVLERTIGIVHQMKGSAGTIGFADLSAAALSLETELGTLADTGTAPSPEQYERMAVSLDRLRFLAERLAPQESQLYNLDLATLRAGR